MNFKAAFYYQIKDHKISLIVYYSVMSLVYAFFTGLLLTNVGEDHTTVINGLDMVGAIFLFVTGLCTIKEPLGMLMQNGISRKMVWKSRLGATLAVCTVMVVIDRILAGILSLFPDNGSSLLLPQLYGIMQTWSFPAQLVVEILLHLSVYLACYYLGYMIGIIFYRLNSLGRVLLSAGLPVTVFVIFPVIDYLLDGKLLYNLFNFFFTCMGVTSGIPLLGSLTLVVLAAVFAGVSWLLMRRISLKEA